MILKNIRIQDIDAACEEFRISEDLNSPALEDSLREIGQLTPVILLARNPYNIIVCGFRRIQALKRLGRSEVWARILSDSAADSLNPFELALRDNISHRQLDPLEKARAIQKLQTFCGIDKDRLIHVYLPLLGLAPHEMVLSSYSALHEIHAGLRQCLFESTLTLSSIETLARLGKDEQIQFASLMTRVRLSASLQKKVLTLLEDLAAMTNTPLTAPLHDLEIKTLLEDSLLSSFQKGEKLHEILYRRRNPRLSLARERFLEQKNLLGLPGCIRINPHPFFETTDVRVEFDVSSAVRFRELANTLQKASQSPELEGLFQLNE